MQSSAASNPARIEDRGGDRNLPRRLLPRALFQKAEPSSTTRKRVEAGLTRLPRRAAFARTLAERALGMGSKRFTDHWSGASLHQLSVNLLLFQRNPSDPRERVVTNRAAARIGAALPPYISYQRVCCYFSVIPATNGSRFSKPSGSSQLAAALPPYGNRFDVVVTDSNPLCQVSSAFCARKSVVWLEKRPKRSWTRSSATAQHRKEIATLSRQLDGLEKRCTFLESQERKRLSQQKDQRSSLEEVRFLPVPSARIVAASTCPPRTTADCWACRPKRSITGNEA